MNMSDRSSRLRELSADYLKKKQQEADRAFDDLIEEVSIHHRLERTMFDVKLKERLYQKSNGRCVWCEKTLRFEDSVIDHDFPLAKGGTHAESNLQLLHDRCNKSKSATLKHLSRDEQLKFLADRFD